MNDLSDVIDLPEQDSSDQQIVNSFHTNGPEFQEFVVTEVDHSEKSKGSSEKLIKGK